MPDDAKITKLARKMKQSVLKEPNRDVMKEPGLRVRLLCDVHERTFGQIRDQDV